MKIAHQDLADRLIAETAVDPAQAAVVFERAAELLKHLQAGIRARHLEEPSDERWTVGYAGGCGDCGDLLMDLARYLRGPIGAEGSDARD